MAKIYDYILAEESAYQTIPVTVAENYEWNMYDHINKTICYRDSKFFSGANDGERPFKNITRPILNLQHRSEGFDVVDIVLFVSDKINYYKSFLVKKYHEIWARRENIDTFIDDMVDSFVDFGGVLVKKTRGNCPEVVPLQRLAFCDQTDILSGPIPEKHSYSPDQLLEMAKYGWGDEKNGRATGTIQDLLVIVSAQKDVAVKTDAKKRQIRTPGKYINVYEVHGVFPADWLDSEGNPDEMVRQLQIVAFYYDKDEKKCGFTLYKGKEKELPYKFLARDKIYGRALGMGGAEELFDPQVWTNYDMIHIKNMLDAASKIILKTTDATLATKHPKGLKDLDNLEIVSISPNTDLNQVDTRPVNMALFERSVTEWEAHAQQMGSAQDALLGKSPNAGTPFKLQDLVVQQGEGLHEHRRGKIATFLREIYRDWIIPGISRDITNGTEFLSGLSLDEIKSVAESLSINAANEFKIERILDGQVLTPELVDSYQASVKDNFMKKGNKHFIEILKEELKDAPIDVDTDIAGKLQLNKITDSLTRIIGQVLANPELLNDQRAATIFNRLIEYSGLNPFDFSSQMPVPKQVAQPIQIPPVPNKVEPVPVGA